MISETPARLANAEANCSTFASSGGEGRARKAGNLKKAAKQTR